MTAYLKPGDEVVLLVPPARGKFGETEANLRRQTIDDADRLKAYLESRGVKVDKWFVSAAITTFEIPVVFRA